MKPTPCCKNCRSCHYSTAFWNDIEYPTTFCGKTGKDIEHEKNEVCKNHTPMFNNYGEPIGNEKWQLSDRRRMAAVNSQETRNDEFFEWNDWPRRHGFPFNPHTMDSREQFETWRESMMGN